MGSGGALEAAQVRGVAEVVVAAGVPAELGVVLVGGEDERRAALPSPDHLGAEQSLLLTRPRLVAEVLAVGGDAGVQLPEDDVRAVPAEDLRGRHRGEAAGLVGVAEDELARLDGWLPAVRGRRPDSFHGGLPDSVLEAERRASGGQLVAVLAPDHLDARDLLLRVAGPGDHRLEGGGIRGESSQRDVHVTGAQGLLPEPGAARADVTELGRAGRHPLPEL